MRTIHISGDLGDQFRFMKRVYKNALKEDNLFHFFNETTEIIIRVSDSYFVDKVKGYLKSVRGIKIKDYEYPFPGRGKYGEGKRSITTKYLWLFLPLYHTYSVAALTMSKDKFKEFTIKGLHGAFNMIMMSQFGELIWLNNYALGKSRLLEKMLGNTNDAERKYLLK